MERTDGWLDLGLGLEFGCRGTKENDVLFSVQDKVLACSVRLRTAPPRCPQLRPARLELGPREGSQWFPVVLLWVLKQGFAQTFCLSTFPNVSISCLASCPNAELSLSPSPLML